MELLGWGKKDAKSEEKSDVDFATGIADTAFKFLEDS